MEGKIGSSRFLVGNFSQFWQHAGEDFQAEVLLIAQSVCVSVDNLCGINGRRLRHDEDRYAHGGRKAPVMPGAGAIPNGADILGRGMAGKPEGSGAS